MVKTRRAAVNNEAHQRRIRDLIGLALLFAGAACLVALVWPQGATVPDAVADALRILAGTGAYVVPLILMFVGAMLLMGFERLTLSHSSYGSLLLFVTYLIWRHVVVIHGPIPDMTDTGLQRVMQAGGIIGALLGTVFLGLFKLTVTYLLLVMMTCMAVVLLVEKPFVEVLKLVLHKPAVATVGVAKKGAAAVKDRKQVTKEDRVEKLASRALEGDKKPRLLGFKQPQIEAGPEQPTAPEYPNPPVKSLPGRRRSETSIDQTAFPMLDTETGGDESFKLPPVTLLKESPPPPRRAQQELTEKIKILEQTLEHFKIQANVVEIAHGPTVTRYEVQLAPGIKVNKIVSLADNLAMSLAAIDVRVEAPIPGKSAIGVEVPNANPAIVGLREVIDSPEFWNAPSKLTFPLGKDVGNMTRYADLAKMPHLLVAGSTNSGKSICLNTLIASLLFRNKPKDVRFIMVDPKRVELSLWDGIPHLMHPVVKDVKQAAGIFREAIREMERRYDMFARMQTRNLDGYNQRVPSDERLPYIVIIVDELADLMMQAGAEIETSICRLAQLARATGIHLVIATQRPSVDVITGTIKANISSRIAFAVSSQVDSRTILDMNGAERLVGRGDMLFLPIDASKPMRIQGCYLSEEETNTIVAHLKEQGPPTYSFPLVESSGGDTRYVDSDSGDDDVDDELFQKAVFLMVGNGYASTSMIQRKFRIGYTRAARIVDLMHEKGIVGPPDGAKPREILISADEAHQMFRTGRYGIPDDLLE